MSGAAFHAGASRQDYATPPEFRAAFVEMLGPVGLDLAATASNAWGPDYITPEEDSLAHDWDSICGAALGKGEWAWLNPPFAKIAPWAAKCAASRASIALLVPASVGANWWAEHVHQRARVLFLRPRISFDGRGPFPKDLALCLYAPGVQTYYEIWNWKKGVPR